MSFLTPTAALIAAGLVVPALVALYFLKRKRRLFDVSSTLLWQKAVNDLRVSTPFQRLRRNLLLLLQLLILLALLLAYARPTTRGLADGGERIAILIDHSGSMNATDVEPSRLDRARELALQLIDDYDGEGGVMIVTFAGRARVVQPFSTDRARLRRAVRGIEPTDERSQLRPALELIDPFTRTGDDGQTPLTVYLLTDGQVHDADDLTVGGGRSAKKYKLDLIPPTLVIARYFSEQQARLDELRAEHETAMRALDEFVEEQEGEEDLLSEVKNDKGKVTKGEIPKRLKALKDEPDSEDEIAALQRCRRLVDAEAKANKAAKDAEAELNQAVLARYSALTEDEIKTLAVDDKWLADICAAIDAEVERITNQLAGRVRELEERYAEPLPAIERDVEELAGKVAEHLEKMGVCADV